MRDDGLRIKLERCDYGRYIAMLIGRRNPETGHIDEVADVKWKKHKHNECLAAPTLALSDATVQGFMDDLWCLGIRPTQEGSAGQLSAVKSHLNDMRAIVAKKLRTELPNG